VSYYGSIDELGSVTNKIVYKKFDSKELRYLCQSYSNNELTDGERLNFDSGIIYYARMLGNIE